MFYVDLYVFKGPECNGEQYDVFKAIFGNIYIDSGETRELNYKNMREKEQIVKFKFTKQPIYCTYYCPIM